MMKGKVALLITCLIVFSVGAQAGIDYGFFCITDQGNDAQIGNDQLSVTVSDASNGVAAVTFTFNNSGADNAVISEIYFDNSEGVLLAVSNIDDSLAGVDYEDAGSVSPGNLPAGNTIGFDATEALSTEPSNPAPHNGVGPDEWLAITFTLNDGKTYADVIDALDAGEDLRIGLHVIAFSSGGSESFVNESDTVGNNVPEPMTMLILGLGSLFLRIKR